MAVCLVSEEPVEGPAVEDGPALEEDSAVEDVPIVEDGSAVEEGPAVEEDLSSAGTAVEGPATRDSSRSL